MNYLLDIGVALVRQQFRAELEAGLTEDED